jgi:hypothetical protein
MRLGSLFPLSNGVTEMASLPQRQAPRAVQGRELQPTEIDQKMHETMSAWYRLQESHDQMAARLATSEDQNRLLLAETEGQRKRIVDLEHRLNYFVRHSTEVATRLIDVKRVIDMAGDTINQTLIDAQRSGYRPPPPGTPREAHAPQSDGGDDPVPQFLQEPNPDNQQ